MGNTALAVAMRAGSLAETCENPQINKRSKKIKQIATKHSYAFSRNSTGYAPNFKGYASGDRQNTTILLKL